MKPPFFMDIQEYKNKEQALLKAWDDGIVAGQKERWDTLTKQDFMRRFAKESTLSLFLSVFLGFKDLNTIHKDLCYFLEENHLFKLILMPRYSFKSSICTIGYILKELVNDPNQRVLIYSDATSKAEAFLTSIKAHIEGRVEGSKFFPIFNWPVSDKAAVWNMSRIVIRGRTTSYPEPSVDTGGQETSKVGMHYDTIIFDDIVSDKNVTTKEQMDKTAECYKKALSLLRPGGKVLIVGTRWHFGDLYGRLIAENSTREVFKLFIKSAISEKGEYLFDNIGKNSLTKEFLDSQKANQGAYTFSCLYQNSPVDPETAVFKVRDFAFYGAVKKDDLYITGTCDPAGEGEDFTAITVVGTDYKMDMHILELVNAHLQPSEIIEKIISLHYKYTFKIFGLEENFFRGMLKQALNDRINKERIENPSFVLFGIHEFVASSRKGQNKTNRIMALQPYHERGAIKFPGEKVELLEGAFSELAYQMIQFPHSAHDDLLDALAYQLTLVRSGGVAKKADFPVNSPAWLEKRELSREIERMNRLPRRLRQRINQELVFS